MYVLTVHIAKKLIWGTNPLLNWEKFKYLQKFHYIFITKPFATFNLKNIAL